MTMRESDIGTANDVPREWVIVVPAMTTADARRLGPVLAKEGFSGHFLDGGMACHMRRYTELRERLEGGDADGQG